MFAKNVFLFRHQRFPWGFILRIAFSVGPKFQFKPAFIVFVVRLPELGGVGRMDEHGNLQLRAFLPDRIDAHVVHGHSFAGGIGDGHAETFINLQSLRAGLDVRFQLPYGALAPAVRSNAFKIDIGKPDEAGCAGAVRHCARTPKSVAVTDRPALRTVGALDPADSSPGQIDHDGHIQAVHVPYNLPPLIGVGPDLMIVHVDKRIPGAPDRMFRNFERRRWIVFFKTQFLGRGRSGEQNKHRKDGYGLAHEVSFVNEVDVDVPFLRDTWNMVTSKIFLNRNLVILAHAAVRNMFVRKGSCRAIVQRYNENFTT